MCQKFLTQPTQFTSTADGFKAKATSIRAIRDQEQEMRTRENGLKADVEVDSLNMVRSLILVRFYQISRTGVCSVQTWGNNIWVLKVVVFVKMLVQWIRANTRRASDSNSNEVQATCFEFLILWHHEATPTNLQGR